MDREVVTTGFDYYDVEENRRRYGQDTPPLLSMDPLGTLDLPISLFVGLHDKLSTATDDRIIRDLFKPSSMHHYEEF